MSSHDTGSTIAEILPVSPCIAGRGPGLWGRLLRRYLARLSCGRLTIQLPGGERIEAVGARHGPEAAIILNSWRTVWRLMVGGDVGFAESYIDGDWDTPDLTALIVFAAANQQHVASAFSASRPVRFINLLRHRACANTKRGAKKNIVAHYDLGNDFYTQWLDRGMSYSSALYRDGSESLEVAQSAKQDRILELLALNGGERVLEIGCGWGGLALRMSEAAGHVVGLTLSPAQLSHARELILGAGLGARIDLRLQDYRDVDGQYDRIVSIEMLEAVGEAYWDSYFSTIKRRLKLGGTAVLQVITIADSRFEDYRREADFIQRYIFPGGMLPSPSVLSRAIEAADLTSDYRLMFGMDYARTLEAWRERFENAWPEIRALGFPDTFRRLWTYYLSYCEGGFRAGALDVGLYRLKHA